MTQANRNKSEAWIASDLLSIQPKSHADIFDRNIRLARIIITENRDFLLDDGHHNIPALLSTASTGSCEGTPQQRPSQLNHGETIRILSYSYNIFKTKDATCQFVLVLDHWEQTIEGLDGGSEHSMDVHSLEAVRNCLQHCLLIMTDTDSGTGFLHQSNSQNLSRLARLAYQSDSQNLTNQSDSQKLSILANKSDSQNLTNQSDSQNLSILLKLANQSNSQNSSSLAKLISQADDSNHIQQHQLQQHQLQQQYKSMESGTGWMKLASSTSGDSSENMSGVTSSTLRPTKHMSVAHLNATSACTEIVPQSSSKIISIVLQDSRCQDENIQHEDQELELSHQSDCNNLRVDCSQGDKFAHQDKKTDTLAVAEESISPTQLLELMAQESIPDSSEKCGKEKVNHPGTNGSKQLPDSHKWPSFLGGEPQLQMPTLWDLFVPSDQMKTLEQLPGWTSSNDSSVASFPSDEFLRLSSSVTNNSPGSESLFSQPTMKDDRKHSGHLPGSCPVSSQSTDGFRKETSSENLPKTRKDSIQNLKMISSKSCDRHTNNDSQVDKYNSSSLFSDAEHEVSCLVGSLGSGFKHGEIIQQQQTNKLEGSKSNMIQKGIILKPHKSNIVRQSDGIVIQKGDERISRKSQDAISQISMANTDNDTNLKSLKRQHGNRNAENHNSSAVSERSSGTLCNERSSRMCKVTVETHISGKPSVHPEVMSRVIDLSSSSSEDIYMIAGHDIYSSSENLVSLTEPEVIVSSGDSENLISSTDSNYSRSSIDSKNIRSSADSKKLIPSADSKNPRSSADSKNPRSSADSKNAGSSADSKKLIPSADPKKLIPSADPKKLVQSADSEKLIRSADSEKLISPTDSQNPVISTNSESVILSDSKSFTTHDTCLPSTFTKSITHIQHPPSSSHTPAGLDTVSKHHITKYKQDTDKCPAKAAALVSSVSLVSACINISSLEASPDAACTVKVASGCQKTSRLSLLRRQYSDSGNLANYVVKGSSSRSDSNSSGLNSGGKRLKSTAADPACQVVRENAKTSVGGGKKIKPHEPLPTQKSQPQKTQAPVDSCHKNQRCQSSREEVAGRKSFSNASCQFAESPVPQPRIVMIDILKSNKIVPGCICLSNIYNTSHPFIAGSNRQQMLANKKDYEQGNKTDYEQGNKKDYEQGNKKDYEQGNKKDYEQGNKKDYEQGKVKYGTRINKRQKSGHLLQSNFRRKHFTISITEIGRYDMNVQQIKPLGQSTDRTRRGSSSRTTGPSEDVGSTTCFTRIRRHEAEPFIGTGGQGKPVQSMSSVKGDSGNTSDLPKVEGTNRKKAVAKRDGQLLRASEYKETESSRALQASSLFKNSGASDWRNIGPVLDSQCSEDSNNSWSVQCPATLAPVAALDSQCSEESNNSWSVQCPATLAPVAALDSQCSEESNNSWSVQCPATLAPVAALGSSCELEEGNTSKLPSATLESQGFVSCLQDESSSGLIGSSTALTESFESSCIHEDGALGSSGGFVPELTDSQDLDSPWGNSRLDQSVSSVIHYVCHGKFL